MNTMQDKYKDYFKNDRFATGNSIELIECGAGYARVGVDIQPDHLNGAGVVHGGLLFTMADFAFAVAVNAYGRVSLSVSTTMTYFDKCNTGKIYAEAKEISRSNKLAHCNVDIYHETGILLASFRGTAYITAKPIAF